MRRTYKEDIAADSERGEFGAYMAFKPFTEHLI
jgi:hypothetical protein